MGWRQADRAFPPRYFTGLASIRLGVTDRASRRGCVSPPAICRRGRAAYVDRSMP
jgi:hypothetical protein